MKTWKVFTFHQRSEINLLSRNGFLFHVKGVQFHLVVDDNVIKQNSFLFFLGSKYVWLIFFFFHFFFFQWLDTQDPSSTIQRETSLNKWSISSFHWQLHENAAALKACWQNETCLVLFHSYLFYSSLVELRFLCGQLQTFRGFECM